MVPIKFIHTSDLHLDTPFRGLSAWNQQLASRLKDATFRSFGRIIDLCVSENVDFLIVAGDIFDGENRSLAAQLKFVTELKRLSDKGIPTYLVCGNHDPLDSWLESLSLPPLVHRFGGTEVEILSHEKKGVAAADIYGISFQRKEVGENLAKRYQRKSAPAPVSIAVLHGTAGAPGPHHNYAPFRVEDVRGNGFDYWALGHIHKHTVVQTGNPAIVYPGNPQGRDFGETGPKGCCLVEIMPGQSPVTTFVPIQLIRFEELHVDLSGINDLAGLSGKVEQAIGELKVGGPGNTGPKCDEGYVVRLILNGRTPLHAQLGKTGEAEHLLAHFNDGQLHRTPFIWIDRIELNTVPDISLEQIRGRNDFAAEVLHVFDVMKQDPAVLTEMMDAVESRFVSIEAKRELDRYSYEDQQEILEKATWILMDQLIRQ
jgi:DNA repair protein SbcD/Mre11